MRDKIRVAFIYKTSYKFFHEEHFDQTTNDFFMNSLKRNEKLEVSYFPTKNEFDVEKIKGKFDVILFANNELDAIPEFMDGINNIGIPIVTKTGDPHRAKEYKQIELHEKLKIDAYWSLQPKEYFYEYYPKEIFYKEILWGIEPLKYQNLNAYSNRIKDRILNSGNIGRTDTKSKMLHKFSRKINSAIYFYKLRTMCNELDYVDYAGMKNNFYINEDYPEYLSRYCSAIATGTIYPVIKFFEIPAAGCLTFMEITEKNHGKYLGFEDNKSAIFINEKNYREKFEKYLDDPHDEKWEKIANAGKEHSLSSANNDTAVEQLVEIMQELIR